MSDDWQIDDLALCIKMGKWRDMAAGHLIDTGPRAGQVLVVGEISVTHDRALQRHTLLGFSSWRPDMFVSRNFIKLRPHQPDAEDEETLRILNGKPADAPENANLAGDCDEREEARAWSQGLGQARSNILQSRVRARDRRGEFKTREEFHRAMLEARNFRGEALEKALAIEIARERRSMGRPDQPQKPSGDHERDGIPVVLCSVIILASSIDRSYPGGLRSFDSDYPEARRNRHLRGLAFMGWGDLELAVGSLETQGLVRGHDMAFGDMTRGEIAACPGIRFANEGNEFTPRWFAKAGVSQDGRRA